MLWYSPQTHPKKPELAQAMFCQASFGKTNHMIAKRASLKDVFALQERP